jgi:hypothetical protein
MNRDDLRGRMHAVAGEVDADTARRNGQRKAADRPGVDRCLKLARDAFTFGRLLLQGRAARDHGRFGPALGDAERFSTPRKWPPKALATSSG